jgi:hypothetical protein
MKRLQTHLGNEGGHKHWVVLPENAAGPEGARHETSLAVGLEDQLLPQYLGAMRTGVCVCVFACVLACACVCVCVCVKESVCGVLFCVWVQSYVRAPWLR